MEKKIIEGTFSKFNIPVLLFAICTTIFLALGFYQIAGNFKSSVPAFDLAAVFAAITAVCCFSWRGSSVVVTNKRIYGRSSFGRCIELPLDRICAVSCGTFGCVNIFIPSGKISFRFLKNKQEIFYAVSELLADRCE